MHGTFQQLDEQAKIELWSCLALKHTKGLGLKAAIRLRLRFGSANKAIVNIKNWASLRISRESINYFQADAWRTQAKEEWNNIQSLGCGIILWSSFPELLKELSDAPLFMYYWGNVSLIAGPCIAVVGSRLCSTQGLYNAGLLSRDLSRAGLSVVSGLAQGIDREAHLAALDELGSSIAVLGTGINLKYPRANEDVFDKLAKDGLILSEFSPHIAADPRQFPIRNRIISGLSLGVVVIEAANRSGSLITARHALEQNRQVYAVPGNPNGESSVGCQELLRQGAVLVRGVSDIIFDLKDLLHPMAKAQRGSESAVSLATYSIVPQANAYIKKKESQRTKKIIPKELAQKTETESALSQTALNTKPELSKPAFSLEGLDLPALDIEIIKLLAETTASEQGVQGVHIDQIINQLKHIEPNQANISSSLTILEVTGLITCKPGLYYALKQK